jgi:ADP-glucose pyrophosphorylase
VLLDTPEALSGEEAALEDFGHHLLPRLVVEGRARAWRMDGYWRDVGTLDSYWQGHMDLLGPEPLLSLERPEAPLLPMACSGLPRACWPERAWRTATAARAPRAAS